MLLMEGKALAGYDSDKRAAIERVATRHNEVERYQFAWLRHLLLTGASNPMLAAYADTRQDGDYPGYSTDYTAEWSAPRRMPGRWRSTRPSASGWPRPGQPRASVPATSCPSSYDHARLSRRLVQLLRHFGAHSRNYVRAGLDRPAQ